MDLLPITPAKRLLLIGFTVCLLVACTSQRTLPAPSLRVDNFPLPIVKWQFKVDDYLLVPLQYANDQLITARDSTGPGFTYFALSAATGQAQWQYTASRGYAPSQRRISLDSLLLSGEGGIEAVSLSTGKRLWETKNGQPALSIDANSSTVFVNVARAWVSALNLTNGSELWRNIALDGDVLYDSTANRLIVIDQSNAIYTVDASNGQILSSTKLDPLSRWGVCGRGSFTNFSLYKGLLVCEGMVIESSTGNPLLRFPDTKLAGLYMSSPAIISDTLYLASDTGVRAVDLTTLSTKWEYRPADRPQMGTNVVVVGLTGYAMTDDGVVHAFDITNGQEVGWLQIEHRMVSRGSDSSGAPVTSLATDGTQLFVGIEDMVFAFGQ
jgi:outer membrane protein assembly factor BamB